MSAVKSRQEIIVDDQKLKGEIEKKHGKSIEELYQEREKRLYDAIMLKVPDRVPVLWGGTYPACAYVGIPFSSVYYDAPLWKSAMKRLFADLEPDGFGNITSGAGAALDILDSNYDWHPGGKLPADVPHQIHEQEYMKADEYDLFLTDPSDYIIRYLMPRVFNSMKPLAKLPPLTNLAAGTAFFTTLFGSPDFEEFARTMKKVSEEQKKWTQSVGDFNKEMASLGFPQDPFWRGEGGISPPFSGFSNSFRGFRGVATDMFRQPDKLKAALATFLEYRIARAKPAVHKDGKPAIGRAGEAHRVSDEFLSKKQFEEFVWPNWKRAIQKTFDLGYDVIAMLWEGRRDKQVEYLNEFPKGKFFLRVQDSDMFLAKEVLGSHTCLAGNVPVAMLCAGSPSEVEEYCKKLIQVCGKNGGFILAPSTGGYGETKIENVKAMLDSVEKYGRYY